MKKEMLDKDIQELKQLVYDLYKYADKGVIAGIATQSAQERILRIETQLSETEEKLKRMSESIVKSYVVEGSHEDWCLYCEGEGLDRRIRHKSDCIVLEAQNWLEETP